MEEKLINFMKIHTFMHNKKLKEYKCMKAKDKKWLELSKMLGITVPEAKRKWKSLRYCFNREEATRNKASGSAAGSVVTWKYYYDLVFLKDSQDHRETSTNLQEDAAEIMEEYDYDLFEVGLDDEESQTLSSTVEADTPRTDSRLSTSKSVDIRPTMEHTSSFESDSYGKTPRKKQRLDKESIVRSAQDQLSAIVEVVQSRVRQKPQLETFFQSVAMLVEGAELPFAEVLDLQQEILNVVKEKIKSHAQK